jgi:hypothetical protein
MIMNNSDQHDGGGSYRMRDLYPELFEGDSGIDVDESERIVIERELMLAWNDLREALISCVDSFIS